MFQKRARVKIIDYGSLEAMDYAQVYPFTQELGKNEPYQTIDCTILEDPEDPKSQRYTEARWFFNKNVQSFMAGSAGSNIMRATFRSKVKIVERPWKDKS